MFEECLLYGSVLASKGTRIHSKNREKHAVLFIRWDTYTINSVLKGDLQYINSVLQIKFLYGKDNSEKKWFQRALGAMTSNVSKYYSV